MSDVALALKLLGMRPPSRPRRRERWGQRGPGCGGGAVPRGGVAE